jgi:hypothetical protein
MAQKSLDEPRLVEIEERLAALEGARAPLQDDPTLSLSRDVVDLGNVPTCGVHKTGEQSIADATDAEIAFGTTTWDTDGMADLSNNGITIQRAGLYLVTCNARFATHALGLRRLRVRVNDTIYFMGQTVGVHATGNVRLSCSTPRYFDIGDTITAVVYQNRGDVLNLNGSTATEHGPQLTATLIADVGDVRTEMA